MFILNFIKLSINILQTVIYTILYHFIINRNNNLLPFRFVLFVYLIKAINNFSVGKSLKSIRKQNDDTENSLPGSVFEMIEVPEKLRLKANGELKEFCTKNYEEYIELGDLNTPLHYHWLVNKDFNTPGKTLYWIHGGGFVFGSPKGYYYSLAKLSLGANCRVMAIEYRKCPEVSILQCIEDVLSGYLTLTSPIEEGGLGISPSDIVIGGGSAGGLLATSLCQYLTKINSPKVAGLLLWSPITDNTKSQPSYWTELKFDISPSLLKKDKFVGNSKYNLRDGFERMAYLGSDKEIRKRIEGYGSFMGPRHILNWPIISPLLSDTLENLPPHFILVGSNETYRDEAIVYSRRVWESNRGKPYDFKQPPVVLQVYDKMPHIFMLLPSYPRVNLVEKRCINFLNNCFEKDEKLLDVNFDDTRPYVENSLDKLNTNGEFIAFKQLVKSEIVKFVPEYEELPYEVWTPKVESLQIVSEPTTAPAPESSVAPEPKSPTQKTKNQKKKKAKKAKK
jgi:acetyl esterase/lipase